ncbi:MULTISPECIES: SH3 domain-containing protein [unclassified Streptomyces]|uniref:SH3 domain-containing protein n=1 Tax=unclassified Streptomyces TaxID=2593676 RepID=UPI00037E765F|nr:MULTISPECIES: SH3 domain-containing protein [unclassified Streptomyces]MYT29904.1 SH3 domain-containing protein [Streptomyces sp. SID8354]
MTHLSSFRRGAAVLASAGLLCGVLGGGVAAAAAPSPSAPGVAHGSYQGRVIARHHLILRAGPGTSYRAVGSLPHGAVVSIRCKVNGERVHGNPHWYKIREGRFGRAWASARYIRIIGKTPRWCR